VRAETPLPCPYRAGAGKVWASPCPYEPLPCPYRPRTGVFNGSGGDNKNERKKWRSMEVIMSMCGVPMEVSGCDDNVECNWQYRWIKLTLKVSERDENGGWIKVTRKTNAVKAKVYENEERRIQWRWRCLHVTLKAITLFFSRMEVPQIQMEVPTGDLYPQALCVWRQRPLWRRFRRKKLP